MLDPEAKFDDSDTIPPALDAPRDHKLTPGVIAALQSVFDPEIPVNIYELGLIYRIAFGDEEAPSVKIDMTVTAPACPVAEELPGQVADAVRGVPGVGPVDVTMVWEPAWHPGLMAETAKLQLNMY